MSFTAYSESRSKLIDEYIRQSFAEFQRTSSQRFSPLLEAMQYSIGHGGKRLRPLIMMASAEALGFKPEDVLPGASAIEYIHTYSLIHDDLPSLDDDDTRRGKPANHIKYGEAMAILAGDALLTEAFGQVLKLAQRFNPKNVLDAIDLLAHSAGVRGMVGGQILDVSIDHQNYTLPEVEFIHIHKTGALITAAVLMPTRLVPLEQEKIQRFKRYGEALGLAFQVSDDLLDSEPLARYSRGPRKKPRPTYTQLMSPSELRTRLNDLVDNAIESIQPLGVAADHLRGIADFIRTRKH